ncbi:MAG: DUF924 family protein [Gammaproteobacteria bacterium]
MTSDAALKLIDFWFADSREGSEQAAARIPVWFQSSEAFDERLRADFGELAERAAAGELDDWSGTAPGRLALIIALDQLPRNLYRRSAKAFAQDAKALDLCLEGLKRGHDLALSPVERVFFYLPLEHAEDLAIQNESCRRYGQLCGEAAGFGEIMKGSLEAVHEHKDLIERFGRFPHRNALLGRESTQAELEHLASGARTFGQ